MKLTATITYYIENNNKKYTYSDTYNMDGFHGQNHALNYIKHDLYSIIAYDQKITFFDIKIKKAASV